MTDTSIEMRPDRTRVVTRFFVPGREEVGPGESRAAPVIERILALDEQSVEAALADLDARFGHRHQSLHDTFSKHAMIVLPRIDPSVSLSTARELLLGAAFTQELAIEGAALCNPSAVLHPEQDDSGDARFVISVRGIGEGHRSSIGFRSGIVTAGGKVTVDPAGPFPVLATPTPGPHHRSVFTAKLGELEDHRENVAFVLDHLPPVFEDASLDATIKSLKADAATRAHTHETIVMLDGVAHSSYQVKFPYSSDISERVLWPHSSAERQGMEDARFVRFVDESGTVTYYATYTAFDGTDIALHLLQTSDFVTFSISAMAGEPASSKGLALFPRKIGGRYAALSRADRETNSIAFSDDVRCWTTAATIQVPEQPWELLQLGNCGSPIETDTGWLVLTHGVGPMRTYSLGAILLDLDAPQRVLARSIDPILIPSETSRDGYVPNVVYSCGGFVHNGWLVLPYGVADQAISIATIPITDLLNSLESVPASPAGK